MCSCALMSCKALETSVAAPPPPLQEKLDESKLKPWQLALKQSFEARRAAAIKKRGGKAKDPVAKKPVKKTPGKGKKAAAAEAAKK